MHKLRLLAFVLLPLTASAAPKADLWAFWEEANPENATQIDHAAWQHLLDTYLETTDDGRTLFDYRAVTAKDRRHLEGYIAGLTTLDPRAMQRAEQLPYWINLYNAATVRVVLDHPGKDSILSMGRSIFPTGPWNDGLLEIAGQQVTLNDIEHRILRPIWQDPRIHYAVNCASVSCPNLATQAYSRENTEQLLDAGEHSYLHHPRGLAFDDGQLRLSSIYKWYVEDFGGSRSALLGYLARQRPDLATELQTFSGSIRYQYDWSLNDARRQP